MQLSLNLTKEKNMENAKERVLAYSKAKEISNEELAEVSGGWHTTTRMTAGASGGSGQGGEAHVDGMLDW